MAIINRLARLFKADFNAILDQVEEPEALLRQAIRDMEEDLEQTEICLRQAQIDKDQLTGRRGELERALADHGVQLDTCFDAGKEDLAREMIKRKLETEYLFECIAVRLEASEKEVRSLIKTSGDNHVTLDSLRQKAELFNESPRHCHTEKSTRSDIAMRSPKRQISDGDIEVAFLQEKKRRIAS